MGYNTDFSGRFTINPELTPEQVKYLQHFSGTRRMKRNNAILKDMPDPIRVAVGLGLGHEGEFYTGSNIDNAGQDKDSSIVNYNLPPSSQVGLWCQWYPSFDGKELFTEGEKFYGYVEWLQYLIDKFFKPWGRTLSGCVRYQGEESDDRGLIWVKDNITKCAGDTIIEATMD